MPSTVPPTVPSTVPSTVATAPPADIPCYACQTPYYGPLAIAPCGCSLPIHGYCQMMLMFRQETCPQCRKAWNYPGSSATSIATEEPLLPVRILPVTEPVPRSHWICTPNCSPFWVVYSIVCFALGGVVVGIFFYFLKQTS